MSNLSTVQTTNVSADSQKSPSSWLEWFMLRDSADLINKGAQGELFQLFNLLKDKDKCWQELEGHVHSCYDNFVDAQKFFVSIKLDSIRSSCFSHFFGRCVHFWYPTWRYSLRLFDKAQSFFNFSQETHKDSTLISIRYQVFDWDV